MEVIRVALVLFILCLAFGCEVTTSDPCQQGGNDGYQFDRNKFRSTAYHVQSNKQALCDISTRSGWYRFDSLAGTEMPEHDFANSSNNPSQNHCGTKTPLWLGGKHPTTVGATKTYSACMNDGGIQTCVGVGKITVKKCASSGTQFYIYRLNPVTSCFRSYCAGNLSVCPFGKSGPPECQQGQLQNDRCSPSAYVEINDPYRSTAHRLKREDTAICDRSLKEGWYRFNSSVGGMIPTSKPEPFHCGTVAPIWMRGTHPAVGDGEVTRQACINTRNLVGGCMYKIRGGIKVFDCGAFYVYYLRPPIGCAKAYCAGDRKPCPRGQVGVWPKCSVSIVADFPYELVPKPRISYQNDQDLPGAVVLLCRFDFPQWSNVSFSVQWSTNRVKKTERLLCPHAQNGNGQACDIRESELHYERKLDNGDGYMPGDEVSCSLKVKYITSVKNKWSPGRSSGDFFAGIKVHPTHIIVHECDIKRITRITINSTVPLYDDPEDWRDDIDIEFSVTGNAFNSIVSNSCSVSLPTKNEIEKASLSMKGVCNYIDGDSNTFHMNLMLASSHVFWDQYKLPTIKVTKMDNPTAQCQATGDPHYTTFDGRYYDFYKHGDFVLYENKDDKFAVHTRIWLCGNGDVSCNCGVAIREHNDVVVLSICNAQLRMNNRPQPLLKEIRSRGTPAPGLQVTISNPGSSSVFTVTLPSGRQVTGDRGSWGMNVYMKAPKRDQSKTGGLCGNYDGDASNDFRHGNQNYNDATSFGLSWRVPFGQSYFDRLPDYQPDTELQMNLCTCRMVRGKPERDCDGGNAVNSNAPPGTQHDVTQQMIDNGTGRRRREVQYSDDIIDYELGRESLNVDFESMDKFHPRFKRAASVMSKENATSICNNLIFGTKAGQVCKEIPGTNLTISVQQCILDLQATGDMVFAAFAFSSMKAQCEEVATKNMSLYEKDESGNMIPPPAVTDNLCPNDCSNQGSCRNGSCVCEEGYTAADCSISVDQGPELFGVIDGGLCDVRRRPCKKTNIFGQGFIDSDNITCHVTEFKVVTSNWKPRNFTMKFRGVMVDLYGVRCYLPDPPTKLDDSDHEGTPAGGVIIAVSNDGVHASSKKVRFVSFDSVCQNCSKSALCTLKPNSCLIDGHCFAFNQSNPRDWCQQCIPTDSQAIWTMRKVNYSPRFTTPSTRYAIVGEYFLFQLKASDPDNRPLSYSLDNTNQTGKAKVSTSGVFMWNVTSNTTTRFAFRVRDECNESDTMVLTVEMLKDPCQNGGKFAPHPRYPRGSGMYVCNCLPGYNGSYCQTNIDECLSSPCVQGTCVDRVNNYTCRCSPGYSGRNCETNINECLSSPCIHGVCTDLVNNYTCSCKFGSSGRNCEVITGFCKNGSCYRDVLCTNVLGGFTCGKCPAGLTGDGINCTEIDDCEPNLCENHGNCSDGFMNYTCACGVGFSGRNCETNINDCVPNPCRNGGTCQDQVNNYTCSCVGGYAGRDCQTDIYECSWNRCQNNATCVDGINNYTCMCAAGFTGTYCQDDINDCVPNPCRHGGICEDQVNNYTCSCVEGYAGRDCKTDIDECSWNRCQNNATCVDGINNYTCTCAAGFTGTYCQDVLPSDEPTVTTTSEIVLEKTSPSTKVSSEPTDILPTTQESIKEVEVEIRLESEEWNEALKNKESQMFKKKAAKIEAEVLKTYSGKRPLKNVKVLAFRHGSIIASIALVFQINGEKISNDDLLLTLRKDVESGKLGSLDVDADYFKVIDKGGKTEEPKQDNKLVYIISATGGGVALVILVAFACVCKKQCYSEKRYRVGDGMPQEAPSHLRREKYELPELEPTTSKSTEKLVCVEEKQVWSKN